MVTQRFRLDVVPNDGPAYEARMSQGDGPVHFEIQVYASKWDFRIPSGAVATVSGRTAAGERIEVPATITSGGTVRFDIPQDVTAEMGRHEVEIVITGSGGEFRSTKFVLGVEGDPQLI